MSNLKRRTPILTLTAVLVTSVSAASVASAQTRYTFQELALPAGTDRVQVRDAAVGMAVGYVIRPDPTHPTLAALDATAWRLDGSGSFINLHRVPPSQPAGVNLLITEALGLDDRHQISGIADRLSPGTTGANEGAFWSSPQAVPFGLAAQASPQLNQSSILDVDGRWAVGEGHRLPSPDAIGDRAWAWDTTNGNRTALLGPSGEGLTYASEIEGRTVIGHRQFTTQDGTGNYVNYWRPMMWDLGGGAENGDLSGLRATELNNGGLQVSYINGVDETGTLGVGQGRNSDSGPNHALAWDLNNPSAAPTNLHSRLPGQYERSSASDALGDLVVGSVVDPNDFMNLHAVAWDLSAGGYIDLHSLLPADIVHSSGTAINRSGQIVGDFKRADGTYGVFVLTPDFTPGDPTGDAVADALDLQILADNFEQDARAFSEGDLTLDGVADMEDLVLMSQVYTPTANTVPGLEPFASFEEAREFFNLPPVPVPEPASMALLACSALILLRRHR